MLNTSRTRFNEKKMLTITATERTSPEEAASVIFVNVIIWGI